MDLQSVRSWKAELLAGSRFSFPTSFRIARPRGLRALTSTRTIAIPAAAFGISPNTNRRNDYRLAVRIFQGQESAAEALLRGTEAHRDEMDIATGVRYRPRLTLRAGGSCGHHLVSAGTLGAFVEDDENYYLLSNNHVLANSDLSAPGDPILQPGPDDIKKRFKIIGYLERAVPLMSQTVDAAIARFSDEVEYFYPDYYNGIGQIDTTPITDRYAVTRVVKRGRTTKVTRGSISAFELDGVSIDYGTRTAPRVVTFDDQIEVVGDPETKPFSAPGDSGSLIIDRDSKRPYALLYGGGPDSQGIDRTLGQFIPDVLSQLNVRFV